MSETANVPSAHHERRWYYALWGLLLALSVGALILWHVPRVRGQAKLTIILAMANLPAQSRIQIWAGPEKCWPGGRWQGEGAWFDGVPSNAKLRVGPILLPIALRRWVDVYIPNRTTDLVVIKASAPQAAPRYLFIPLREDLNSGLIRPARRLNYELTCDWASLPVRDTP